jgi:rod shape-determining protein MreC
MRLVVAGLFLLTFLLFQARMKPVRQQNWFDRSLMFISAPVQNAFVWSVDSAVSLWTQYVWLVQVEQDNQRLRQRIDELELSLSDQAECQAENTRLHALVGLAGGLPEYRMVAARVISVGTSPAAQVIRIDAGSSAGVEVGDAVLAGPGLVGRVTGVVPGYAEVHLVIDARSAVDVVVQRSRARGIVRGQGASERFIVEHVVRTADVQEGDLLVTSGIGGGVPPGLPVGRVTSVTSPPAGVFRNVEALQVVDFDILEEVLVVISRTAQTVAPEPSP